MSNDERAIELAKKPEPIVPKETLEQAGKALAILGTIALLEGVLFNAVLFYVLGSNSATILSIGDQLSTSATHLPYLVISTVTGFLAGQYYAELAAPRPADGIPRKKGQSSKVLWLALGVLWIMAFHILNERTLAILTASGFFMLWWVEAGGAWAEERLLPDASGELRRFFSVAVFITAMFCGWAAAYAGLMRIAPTATVHAVSDNGKEIDGMLVGFYDRGTIFLTKPGNQIAIVSQRASLVVDYIAAPESHVGKYRKAVLNWWHGPAHDYGYF